MESPPGATRIPAAACGSAVGGVALGRGISGRKSGRRWLRVGSRCFAVLRVLFTEGLDSPAHRLGARSADRAAVLRGTKALAGRGGIRHRHVAGGCRLKGLVCARPSQPCDGGLAGHTLYIQGCCWFGSTRRTNTLSCRYCLGAGWSGAVGSRGGRRNRTALSGRARNAGMFWRALSLRFKRMW